MWSDSSSLPKADRKDSEEGVWGEGGPTHQIAQITDGEVWTWLFHWLAVEYLSTQHLADSHRVSDIQHFPEWSYNYDGHLVMGWEAHSAGRCCQRAEWAFLITVFYFSHPSSCDEMLEKDNRVHSFSVKNEECISSSSQNWRHIVSAMRYTPCFSSCTTLNHNRLWTPEGFYYVKQYIHKPLWKSCECFTGKRQWTGEPVWMRSCQFCCWIPLTVLRIVLKRNSKRYMLNGLMHFQNDTKTGCLCVHSVSSSVATLSSESKPKAFKDCDILQLITWYINMSLVFTATVEPVVCVYVCVLRW